MKQLVSLGIDLDEPGWIRNQGLRIIGGGNRLELPWPDVTDYPSFGLVRTRMDFDEILARHAQKAGARLHERTAVTGPVLDEAGRIVGVTAKPVDDNGRKVGDEVELPRPDRRCCRRQLHPAQPRDGTAEARQPPDGRRGPHLLPQPPPRRRLAGVVAGAVGRQAG